MKWLHQWISYTFIGYIYQYYSLNSIKTYDLNTKIKFKLKKDFHFRSEACEDESKAETELLNTNLKVIKYFILLMIYYDHYKISGINLICHYNKNQ